MVQHVVLLAVSVKANVYRYIRMYMALQTENFQFVTAHFITGTNCGRRLYVGTSPTDCAISPLRQVVTSPSLKPPNTALQWLLEYYVVYTQQSQLLILARSYGVLKEEVSFK